MFQNAGPSSADGNGRLSMNCMIELASNEDACG
jgi:hypothetical protein